ncbi:MAG: hypothetical protein WB999_13345 [Candidatus Binataceae bacterium]
MAIDDTFLADPALYGLDGRVPGSPCPAACSRDCTRGCHEAHKATGRLHDPYYCQQLTLGRDVSEYEPEVRQWWEAELRAARAQAMGGWIGAVLGGAEAEGGDLFGGESGHFRDRRPSWPVRLLLMVRATWRP